MRPPPSLAASSLAFIQLFATGFTLPSSDVQIQQASSANLQIEQEIASIICQNSTIVSPNDTSWAIQIERFMQNVQPQIQLSVQPGSSGGCKCVSLLGPALGGGHGLQQGQHGLAMDHFVNLNVVLANGTAVSVNASSYPDLWWAMRGAGHNFGIVTSFDSKIWRDDFKKNFVKVYQFAGKSHDILMERAKEFQGNGTLNPEWLASFGSYSMDTNLSTTEASNKIRTLCRQAFHLFKWK
ncbi:MAG: hypothetical protein Q9204_001023 [Flavoplaca sp. TL-2023a]